MKSLCVFLIFVIGAAVAFVIWASRSYSLQKVQVGDDYLLLAPEQAKECAEGGGCAVFSEREFNRAVGRLMLQRDRT